MKNKEYKRHVYDLELKSMLHNYETEIKKVELNTKDKTPEYFAGLIEFVIKNYCKSKGIKFNKEGQVLVQPEANGPYCQFLGSSLIFYEVHKINQYLNYHQQLFDAVPDQLFSFVNLIEFTVVNTVKDTSPFDNSKRLETIMGWVENKKNQLTVATKIDSKKLKKIFDPENDFLIWDDERLLIKIDFSFALAKFGFTETEYEFVKVFEKKRKVDWKKGLASWVYFIHMLNKDKYITTSKGEVPYLKIGRHFFKICDDPKNKIEDLSENLSGLLYNVLKSTRKHVETRKEVDLMIKWVADEVEKRIKILPT